MTHNVEPAEDEIEKIVKRHHDRMLTTSWEHPNKSYTDKVLKDAIADMTAYLKLQQEALLNRVEKEVIGDDGPIAAYSQPGMYEINETNKGNSHKNQLRAEQRTAVNKLRLEL